MKVNYMFIRYQFATDSVLAVWVMSWSIVGRMTNSNEWHF